MILRLFKTSLRTTIADRNMVFWTIMFPLILGTLFNFAFSNLNDFDVPEAVPVAVIKNEAYRSDVALSQTVDMLSTGRDKLFDIKKVSSKNQALEMLDEQRISGIIESNGQKPIVTVKGVNNFNETIVKTAVEQSLQTGSAVMAAVQKDPSVMAKLGNAGRTNYLKEYKNDNADRSAIYFYTLIGMACLYASFFGIYAVNRIEANQSKLAMRLAASPVSKARALLAALLSGYVVALFGQGLLYLYLTQILDVSFGSSTGSVALTMLVGSLAGLMLGAFVGAASSLPEGRKVDVLIIITMVCSMLAGMMGTTNIKHAIDLHAPVLASINPVNLISDALYSTYYFGVGERYWTDMLLLGIFSIIVMFGTWLVSRRKSYASL